LNRGVHSIEFRVAKTSVRSWNSPGAALPDNPKPTDFSGNRGTFRASESQVGFAGWGITNSTPTRLLHAPQEGEGCGQFFESVPVTDVELCMAARASLALKHIGQAVGRDLRDGVARFADHADGHKFR